MRVLILPEVREYFKELQIILYEKYYFGHEDAAQKYTDELLEDILTNLPTKLHKPAPEHFDKFGKNMKYAAFRKNRHTCWYAFFKTYNRNGEKVFLVRYIANNHTVAQYLS